MPHAVWSAVAVFRQQAERGKLRERVCSCESRANHKAPRPCSRESPVAMMSRSRMGQERNGDARPPRRPGSAWAVAFGLGGRGVRFESVCKRKTNLEKTKSLINDATTRPPLAT